MLYDLQRGYFSDLASEMRRMLDTFGPEFGGSSQTGFPPVDIHETDDDVLLTADVPGFRCEDLSLEIDGRQLVLRGEKREPELAEGESHLHRERRFGRFERTFTLNFSVDRDKVAADCANGVLTIRLPKAEAAKPRRITVNAAS
jgi:HSP20 family protein